MIGAFAGLPLLPARAHEPHKHTLVSYAYYCPRSGRPRPPRPRHLLTMWTFVPVVGVVCGQIVIPAIVWTASGPQCGPLAVHMFDGFL